jgi:hypothetical protein
MQNHGPEAEEEDATLQTALQLIFSDPDASEKIV